MKNISRNKFLRQTLGVTTLAILTPFPQHILPNTINHNPSRRVYEGTLYEQLVQHNDQTVKTLLIDLQSDIEYQGRALGYNYAILAASYSEPSSNYYKDKDLISTMSDIIDVLSKAQMADGTLDFGNLGSPPDTAFLLEPLCGGAHILNEYNPGEHEELKAKTKEFILKTGEALVEGGVHTANHRWVLSAALAKINALYPNPKYVARIEEWLAEGIFNDEYGHFQERSKIYSGVIDEALITLSRLLKIPNLLDPVRKNLEMTYYYMDPNGDLITFDSRRQDKSASRSIIHYYNHYRYLAIKDKNGEFASITKFIEGLEDFESMILDHSLYYFMENPVLKENLPQLKPLNTDFEKFFKTTNLARIRRDNVAATIFGGVDWPLIIASGRSTSPNFFSFAKGEAVLKYIRMSGDFFSTGYFRSDGLRKIENTYILSQNLEVPYYQPLPKNKRRSDGDYELSQSIDGRFWNKMAFEDRATSNIKKLNYKIKVTNHEGQFDLVFEVDGTDNVAITIELCFKEGGSLKGVQPIDEDSNDNILKNGMGEYRNGENVITFGPGLYEHNKTKNLEGEIYSSHSGTLRTDGMHVYLTGKTPLKYSFTIS